MKYKKAIFSVLSGILLIVAVLAWLSYVGQGIAYGDLVGVRGHEKDLAEVGKHAVHALWIAGCAEALAVLLLWWGISDPAASTEVRMGIGLALALLADLFTYALVRGL